MLVVRRVLLPHYKPLLRPRHQGHLARKLHRMSALAQAGQVRPMPDSEVEVPEAKKVRLDIRDDVATASATPSTSAAAINPTERKREHKKSKRKYKQKKPELAEPGSPEDLLWHEIKSVLGVDAVERAIQEGIEYDSPFLFHQEVEVVVKSLSPSGDAVAIPVQEEERKTPWAVIIPFSLPGEIVRAKIYRNARMHSVADLVEVVTPNLELRDDSRIQCRYFGKCAGCQYQMLSYETQLSLKRDVIIKAYNNFSDLPTSSVPTILLTIGSPLQYGYRTKITPHFEAASKFVLKKHQRDGTDKAEVQEQPDWLKIGFNVVGTRKVLDIEECPIATGVINEALTLERERIIKNIYTFQRGASLILRDSLDTSIPLPPEPSSDSGDVDHQLSEALNKHVCITSHTAAIRETVGGFIFEYPASSFFQNNNSILVPLTEYVRDAIFPSSTTTDARPKPTHLVDTYCGSGLFAITLSPHFEAISGIELSTDSIRSAKRNVSLNNALRAIPSFGSIISSSSTTATSSSSITNPTSTSLPLPEIEFRSGTASNIFSSVSSFPRRETVVVIDPPRKGCDDEFIRQVVRFRPGVMVYVSCNVHTQARDVGKLLRMVDEAERKEEGEGGKKGKYVLESVRGFDLFPQTAHVESVAVLRLV